MDLFDTIAKKPTAEEIAELSSLRAEIQRHNGLYHTDDNPEISDAAFDAMVRRHNEIEDLYPELASGDAPTQKVGARSEETTSELQSLMRTSSSVFCLKKKI